MADGYIGGVWADCEHYTVIDQYEIDERWPDDWDEENTATCYCGEHAPYRAKVAFHRKMRDDEPYGWGNSITMEWVVDRCKAHKFESDGV